MKTTPWLAFVHIAAINGLLDTAHKLGAYRDGIPTWVHDSLYQLSMFLAFVVLGALIGFLFGTLRGNA